MTDVHVFLGIDEHGVTHVPDEWWCPTTESACATCFSPAPIAVYVTHCAPETFVTCLTCIACHWHALQFAPKEPT